MPPIHHVKVRPGDEDWDAFIQWLYNRENHGIEQMMQTFVGPREVIYQRGLEALEGRFLNREALPEWYRQ